MEGKGILKELKLIYPDAIDNNGNLRTMPIGLLAKRKISMGRFHLLQSFIKLIIETDIVNKETKLYISNPDISYRSVNRAMNELNGNVEPEIPERTTQSKIGYGRRKLMETFGEDIVTDIAFKTMNDDKIRIYEEKITKAYREYAGGSREDIRDGIALTLDKDSLCGELSDDKFDQFIDIIKPYLKHHMEAVSANMDEDSIGYFNNLMFNPNLNNVDKERLALLEELVNPSIE